jgi:hypothetical protein
MAHESELVFNPGDDTLPDDEQIPAKIWELLRRNDEFKKAARQLQQLDEKARATKRSGSEWKESCRMIGDIQSTHPLAALALQWLVPEPLFSKTRQRDGQIEDGTGLSPDFNDSSWIWVKRNAAPQGAIGHYHKRGPEIAAHYHDWKNWRQGEVLFSCDTPWPRSPKSFRRRFKSIWRKYYDSLEAFKVGLFEKWKPLPVLTRAAKSGKISGDDFGAALEFNELIHSYHLFAVSPVMLTSGDVRSAFKKLGENYLSRQPPKRENLFGTKAAWRHYIARKDRGLTLRQHILGTNSNRESDRICWLQLGNEGWNNRRENISAWSRSGISREWCSKRNVKTHPNRL